MNARRLHAILRRHEIDPKFWPDFRAMVELGQNAGKELLTRMNRVANFELLEKGNSSPQLELVRTAYVRLRKIIFSDRRAPQKSAL